MGLFYWEVRWGWIQWALSMVFIKMPQKKPRRCGDHRYLVFVFHSVTKWILPMPLLHLETTESGSSGVSTSKSSFRWFCHHLLPPWHLGLTVADSWLHKPKMEIDSVSILGRFQGERKWRYICLGNPRQLQLQILLIRDLHLSISLC